MGAKGQIQNTRAHAQMSPGNRLASQPLFFFFFFFLGKGCREKKKRLETLARLVFVGLSQNVGTANQITSVS